MRLVRYLGALVMCMALLANAAPAMDNWQLADNMPRKYSGTFAWRASPDQKQSISLIFDRMRTTEKDMVEMEGRAKYTTDKVTWVEITAIADPRTLHIEIFEAVGLDQKWATDGSHQGKLSPDLRTITAVWTTTETGKQGDLTLKADLSK